MEERIKKVIEELRKDSYLIGGKRNPNATVNTWYVIALLQDILNNKVDHPTIGE